MLFMLSWLVGWEDIESGQALVKLGVSEELVRKKRQAVFSAVGDHWAAYFSPSSLPPTGSKQNAEG